MKKFIFYSLILTILYSCSKEAQLDRKDVNSVPEYLIQAIQKNDTTSFLKLFDYNLNPSITDSSEVRNLNIENFKLAHNTFKDKKIEFLKFDTIDGLNGGEIIDDESLNIYVKVEDKYYKLRLTDYTAKNENYFLIFYLNDLTSECKNIEGKPYQPSPAALFKNLNYDTFNGHIFNNVNVVFTNLTQYDITKIKFRLTIENEENIVFHQTIISEKPIYKGDINGVTINELRGVDAGFLLNEGNFDWNVEVLDVEPKPDINPCAKIEQLKSLK